MDKIKLMVIDDNREFCLLVRDYSAMVDEVEFCGAALDGITALEQIRERKPDIILLDNVMPHLDGIGVMKHLHNFACDTRPKVVALTACPTNFYLHTMYKLGADYITSKNMDIDEIIKRCIDICKNRGA